MTTNTHSPQTDQTQDLQEFRVEVSAWLEHNRPDDPGFLLPQTFMEVGSEKVLEFLREWQHKVWSAGYLGMAWPKKYGGQGMAPKYQSIVDQEMKRLRVPICFNVIGLGRFNHFMYIVLKLFNIQMGVGVNKFHKHKNG